jgi:hypothetical protein
MLKRLYAIILLAMLVIAPNVHVQAGGDWFSYVYNVQTFELVRVHLSGEQETVSLGLPEGYRPGEFAFSPNGYVLAYCATADNDVQNGHPHTQLVVRDLEVGGNIFQLDMGYPAGCLTTKDAFNEDGTQFAVGIVNYFMDEPDIDSTQPNRTLQIYDLNSLNLAVELNAATPIDPMMADLSMMPQVRYFAHDIVVFRELPWGMGGMVPDASAYMWDAFSGSLDPIEHWGAQTVVDIRDRGELFWLEHDDTLPQAEPFGEGSINNVVRMAGKNGAVSTIYHTPDWLIIDMAPINDGRELALLLSAQDPNSADFRVINRWIALDRSGATTVLGESEQWSVIRSAPTGYVLFATALADPNDPTTRSFSLSYVTGGSPSELWSTPQADSYWDLVWAMNYGSSSDIAGPFTAIQR